MPRWWPAGAGDVGFHDALDQTGVAISCPLRARVQPRQLYVYATAGALGWAGPWREAVAHGAKFLLRHAMDGSGLAPSRYDADGRPAPGPYDLYDQAFVLFGHAHALRATGDTAHREAAERLLASLIQRQGRADGGFEEDASPGPVLRTNPHMHLLEAALAWVEIDGGPRWRTLARGLCGLATTRFIDPETSRLRELFDPDARPLAGEDGDVVEPGHQFEWCWLLDRADVLSVSPWPESAGRMATAATETGVDRARNVAIDRQRVDGSWSDANARLWPQTERIRAALTLRRRSEGKAREDWGRETLAAVDGLRQFLDRPSPGLWRDRMDERGALDDGPVRASSFYHIVGALTALIEAGRAGS